jgi:hypothetical protein
MKGHPFPARHFHGKAADRGVFPYEKINGHEQRALFDIKGFFEGEMINLFFKFRVVLYCYSAGCHAIAHD